MNDLPLVTTIAAAFTAAWLLGLLTQRIGLSPIVGYLLAGILIGPHTPGFVGDVKLAQQLAEVGVILLMFGVGLHFQLKDLLAVKRVAIPGAVGQSLIATLAGVATFTVAFGWPLRSSLLMGMAIAVASTVVLIRVLSDHGVLETPAGHVAVGWLIIEDLFTVALLVLIPAMAGGTGAPRSVGAESVALALGTAFLKLAALVGMMAVLGARAIPWMMVAVARLRSRELFTLTVLVLSIAMATGAHAFFGVSMALGAFLAGMVIAQSAVSHQVAAEALPLRDAFAVLFFVAVGMLFNPAFVMKQPLMIVATLAIVVLLKPATALAVVLLLGHTSRNAMVVAFGLAQVGEFSFILLELGRKYALLPDAGYNAIVAAAIVSITLNPLLFKLIDPIENALRARPRLWKLVNRGAQRRLLATNARTVDAIAMPDERRPRQAVGLIAGYGHVGRAVDELLCQAGLKTVVIDLNMDTVLALRGEGRLAVYGDATQGEVLDQAGAPHAAYLIITLPQTENHAPVVARARQLNPGLKILVRARYLREVPGLAQAGATATICEEEEAAVALARLTLSHLGADPETIARETLRIREAARGDL